MSRRKPNAEDGRLNAERERSIAAVTAFVELMRACERSDLSTAADAQSELAQLGVTIRLRWPGSQNAVVDASEATAGHRLGPAEP